MKLKYKILWIDDDTDAIERPKTQIKRYIEEDYGFECTDDDVTIKDYDEFESDYVYEDNGKKTVKDSIKEFDLLLVDFDLGEEGQTGDILINLIRNKVYSEILFYSTNYSDLRSKLNNNDFMDGVFTSSRDELEEKTKKLINVTIKKVQDVNNLRGLIMAEVAELDRLKKAILLKYNAKYKDDSVLKKYVKEDVFNKINQELADLDCIINPECTHDQIDFGKLLNNFFYDSFKKSRTVFKVKNLHLKCKEIPFNHQDYYTSVIKKRNVLAHQKEDEDASGKFLLYPNGDRLDFTEEHCKLIRQDIKKYKELLKAIDVKLDE